MVSLTESISKVRPFKALVVGDLMLDELLYGDADRLSNDAPVPVLHVKSSEHRPGGAANVCLNLVAMGASVSVFGVTGNDAEAKKLRTALNDERVGAEGLVADNGRPTTVKRSLIGLAQHRHPQKMFRVDFESSEPLSEEVASRLIDAFDKELADADVVCIEDYNKGVCTREICQEIISRARAADKPVLVDPAAVSDYAKYRGATCITPNRTEAEKATGLESGTETQNNEIARTLLNDLDLETVVVTLDRHGALLLERGRDPIIVPTVARQVYDVTGAGDMVLAGLAAGAGCGLAWENSVALANTAAGLEVEIFGVEPIPLARIRHEVLKQAGRLQGKLRTAEQARLEADVVRKTGGKVIFTNGCFDIIHAGHISMLERSAEHGAMLIVGLNDDDSIRRLKGEGRPVNSLEDRARVLGAVGCVDAVVPFSEDTPIRLIEEIKPDVLIKGADYRREEVVGYDIVESYGGRVELIDLVEGKSTTGTIERMKAR
ncbi:MAG: D-glycero-beta-D-manno-heptose 1-phosphate adenylyltransferase [Phycisphaera sp.]|nr:MAG: D-glycero-beta-D-manno-heptose 1-phosphate adenylyltransferase [Phycisphaera sp.]